MRARRAVMPATVVAALALLASCAPPDGLTPDGLVGPLQEGVTEPGVTHVHALDVDEAAGVARVATHYGIYAAPLTDDGSAIVERVGDWAGDAMGMARTGDRIVLSGHPAADESGPPNLGVASLSTEGTVTIEALDGQVDFHAMAATGARIAGWDSVSGAIHVSADGGSSWTTGAVQAVRSLAWVPDGSALLATTPDGVLASMDEGATVSPVTDAPSLVLIAANGEEAASPRMAGVDVEGVLHVSTDGVAWSEVGELPILPDALAVSDSGRVAIASTSLALISDADGRNWQSLFRY